VGEESYVSRWPIVCASPLAVVMITLRLPTFSLSFRLPLVAALVHDVIIHFGLFSNLRLEF